MKTCPTCHQNYDNEMKFCLNDGSLLVAETASGMTAASGIDATLHLPGHSTEQPPNIVDAPQTSPQQATMTLPGGPAMGSAPAVPNVGSKARGSNALLWLGAALIVGIAAIALAVALVITRTRRPASDSGDPAEATASPSETGSDPNRIVVVEPPPNDGPPSASPTSVRKGVVTTENPASKGAPIAGVPSVVATDAPPPPPAPVKAPAVISGGVLNGKAIRLVQPAYPPIAKAAHASGAVRVQVLIDEAGNVVSASAVSGHPLLQGSAVSAARGSKFTPTKLSGQPVKVTGVIVYNFVAQ